MQPIELFSSSSYRSDEFPSGQIARFVLQDMGEKECCSVDCNESAHPADKPSEAPEVLMSHNQNRLTIHYCEPSDANELDHNF
mmetsp:Transcript_42985/g.118900  ORF Transcript_42985/g.118900 Transcript_42985/m.118900 type:complete len:83 (+) Transcript_42985:469-717(+)